MTIHLFIFAAQQLQRIGCKECCIGADGSLQFRVPFHMDSYLVLLATVVNDDGSLNEQSHYAERFALCLDHRGDTTEAVELFLAIMDEKPEVLLVPESPQIRLVDVSPFADTPGKLGRIAVQRFGELSAQHDHRSLAIRLFRELVEKIPAECVTMSLIDARVRALQCLRDLGVKTLRFDVSVTHELEKMRERQF